MALIASVDGALRRAYLDISTINTNLNPIDIYKELRGLRVVDESLRQYRNFLTAFGNKSKTLTTSTERGVIENLGFRIVPFDIDHTLTITGTIITDDGQSNIDCFDLTGLTNTVNFVFDIKQVEVIEVNTSGSTAITQQEKVDIVDLIFSRIINGTNTIAQEFAELKGFGIDNIHIDDTTGIMTLYESDMITIRDQWQLYEDSNRLVKFSGKSTKILERVKL